MIRLRDKQKKVLVSVHLAFVGIWLGALVCSLLLLIFVHADISSQSEPAIVNSILRMFYFALLLPSAIGSIKSGILLSILTHWGLTKYYWVIVKLAVSVSMIALLTLLIGRVIASNSSELLLNNGMMVFGFSVQISSLLILIVISVFKPWGKVKKVNKNLKGSVINDKLS